MIDKALLWSGNNIPFPQAQVIITQPKVGEIAMLGENNFFLAVKILTISKENFELKDKVDSANQSNFQILMSIIENSKDAQLKDSLNMLLTILFPSYKVIIDEGRFLLMENKESQCIIRIIDETNFDFFVESLKDIFCLRDLGGVEEFNPINDKARRIAEKIKRGRAKAAADKGQDKKDFSIIEYYSKILCMNGYTPIETNNFTLYQLYELAELYKHKINFEEYKESILAGADKDSITEVEHWLNLFQKTDNNFI